MKKIFLLWATCLLFSGLFAQTRLKVMHYNLLSFGNPCTGVTTSQKYQWLGTILNHYQPDIFTVNELNDQTAYVNGIKQLSFSYTNAVGNADFTNQTNSNIVNQLFYNTDVLAYNGVEVIPGSIRDINVYELYLRPEITQVGLDTTFLYCIVAHFKAGQGGSDEVERANSATSIMNWVSNFGDGKNILMMGDLNLYGAGEPAFQTLVFNANTEIRFQDPAGKQSGWGGAGNAIYHTQSTRSSSPDCGSGGGMDDRFDFILANDAVMQGSNGVQYETGSYRALGNDGDSYNQELDCDGTPVPVSICAALKQMSDHLPVVMELEFSRAVSIADELLPRLAQVRYQPDGTVSVSLEQTSLKHTAQLWDLSGRRVWETAVPMQIDEIFLPQDGQLSPGFYMLVLRTPQGIRWREKVWLSRTQ